MERTSRQWAAQLLRHLGNGRLTNFAFEETWERFVSEKLINEDEDGVYETFSECAWPLYGDYKEHYVSLSPEGKKYIARWVLFLQSDAEYTWPSLGWLDSIKQISEFLSGGHLSFPESHRENHGHWEVYPFRWREDYEAARRQPKLLCGAKNR